jgi:outer membrane protein
MKKQIIFLFLLSFVISGLSQQVFGQQKIGCIDSNELIASMPENEKAVAAIETKTNEFVTQSQELQVELNRKYEKFLAQSDSLSSLIRQSKQAEINDLAKNVEKFNAAADQELNRFRQEIYKPIVEKAQNAIKEVATEEGFTYIIDLGTNVALFFPEEAPFNILDAVKAKLGISIVQ